MVTKTCVMKDGVKEGEKNELVPVFHHPFNMIISGPSQSGKTYFVMQMLKDKQIMPYPDDIYLLYAVYQTLFDDLKWQGVITDSFKGIEGALILLEEREKQKLKLFIFDDLQTEVVNSRKISSLFKYGTHHMNALAILIWQNMYPQGSQARNLALNIHYNVVFNKPVTSGQFKRVAQQRDAQYKPLISLYYHLIESGKCGPMVINNKRTSCVVWYCANTEDFTLYMDLFTKHVEPYRQVYKRLGKVSSRSRSNCMKAAPSGFLDNIRTVARHIDCGSLSSMTSSLTY